MPSPSPGSPGMIANTAAGYRLAWAHRRQLSLTLLPIVAAASIGLTLLDLFLGRDQLVIINGAPVVQGGGERLGWATVCLVAVCWLVALSAGAIVTTGGARGRSVRPVRAILATLRHLPASVIGMCAAIGVTIALLWVVAGFAGASGGGVVGLLLVLGTLGASGVVAARMLVGVLSQRFGGSGWGLTRGRVAGTAGAFLLGGVAVPLVPAYLVDRLLSAVSAPMVSRVLGAVLVTVVVAAQAGILAHVYLLPREVNRSSGAESVDLGVLDPLVAELSGPAPRRPWPVAVAVVALAAVLAPAGVAVANPVGAPTVRSHDDVPWQVSAVAWPAGRHPVLATLTGARFCDNDVCDRHAEPDGGPPVYDGRGASGISADGDTVLNAAVSGGESNGGPFVHYATCTRAGCPEAWLPVRASAAEKFAWPELAVAVAPDRALWFALATPSEDDRPGEAHYRITLIRCADARCAAPRRHRVGTVRRMPDDGTAQGSRIRLAIGADGRPVATVLSGTEAGWVTCAPVTCDAPRTGAAFTGQPTVWAAPDTPAEPVITFEPGRLRIGDRMVDVWSDQIAPRSGAVTTSGDVVYATAAEAATPRGLRISIGTPAGDEQPEHWQQVLWRCPESGCRRQVLDSVDTTPGPELLAVGADGRVLLVRSDRILLVSTPARS